MNNTKQNFKKFDEKFLYYLMTQPTKVAVMAENVLLKRYEHEIDQIYTSNPNSNKSIDKIKRINDFMQSKHFSQKQKVKLEELIDRLFTGHLLNMLTIDELLKIQGQLSGRVKILAIQKIKNLSGGALQVSKNIKLNTIRKVNNINELGRMSQNTTLSRNERKTLEHKMSLLRLKKALNNPNATQKLRNLKYLEHDQHINIRKTARTEINKLKNVLRKQLGLGRLNVNPSRLINPVANKISQGLKNTRKSFGSFFGLRKIKNKL